MCLSMQFVFVENHTASTLNMLSRPPVEYHLPSHVKNNMTPSGIVTNGVSRYAMKKGSQHITKPPTTMDRVCAVLLSLLKEATRLVGRRGRDMFRMRMSTDVTSSMRDSGRDGLRL